jgi:hypothetical protein
MVRNPAVTGTEPPDGGGEVQAILKLLERLYDEVRARFLADLARTGHAPSAEDRRQILKYIRGMRDALGRAAGGDWRPLQDQAETIRSLVGKQVHVVPTARASSGCCPDWISRSSGSCTTCQVRKPRL